MLILFIDTYYIVYHIFYVLSHKSSFEYEFAKKETGGMTITPYATTTSVVKT